MKGEQETKKSLVVDQARRDPFLTVEEIAASVGTTPRYVRTVLSEARLSLAQLRKAYARQMERVAPQGSHGRRADWTPLSLYDSLEIEGIVAIPGEIAVRKGEDPVAAAYLGLEPHSPLLLAARCLHVDGKPLLYNTVATVRDFSLRPDPGTPAQPLSHLLGLNDEERPRTSVRIESVEGERIPSDVREALTPSAVLVVRQGLGTQERRIGLESFWIDGTRLRFTLGADGQLRLEWKTDDLDKVWAAEESVDVG